MKICKECGKEFKPARSNQIFCSTACKNKYHINLYNTWKNREERYIKCIVCGKPFLPKTPKNILCSLECAQRKIEMDNKESMHRPLTKETAYFVQKWHKEGDSFERIAKALTRTVESVKAANEIELSKYEQWLMKKYFMQKKGAKANV